MSIHESLIEITGTGSSSEPLLTPEVLDFLSELHHKFNDTRKALLLERHKRQVKIDAGEDPTFLQSACQTGEWSVAPAPKDLEKRWVEITGPTDRKMLINALNSGANVFMADFEDANSPTWRNNIDGQQNLIDAIAGTISFESPDGKTYRLNDNPAVLMVRPRGWHLEEKHLIIDGHPISASLFDFGVYFFHNAHKLILKGSGPYFYLPKLESHLEARLWNEVFIFAQKKLNIPVGTVRATVLLETILAAFEMEEILYELREHSSGLNAGRWDYIFSAIKKFRSRQNFLFPDRSQITMTVPFMRAYTELLVKTCHKRGAHAIGGMAAFIPSRKDAALNELALSKVREDKVRESTDGFDGTWVAHPDLVPIAKEVFENYLNGRNNQKNVLKDSVQPNEKKLIEFSIPDGKITEEGVRKNISIALQYLSAWLSGVGAVGIFNMMEDAATAEISRAQLWQWLHHKPTLHLDNGLEFNSELYLDFANEEMEKIQKDEKNKKLFEPHLQEARTLLDALVLEEKFHDFLTLLAYEKLISESITN